MPVQKTNLLVIGSANVDLVAQVPRCPKDGESLIGRSFATVCGGKGANQAVAAARLGARTWFAGCVGADSFGGMQRKSLTDAGVDISHLKTHPDEPTGTAMIYVADSGQNSIVVIPSANFALSPNDINELAPLFAAIDVVLLQLEIPLDTIEAALDLARAHGVTSILDAGPAQAVAEEIIQKADVVSPNETEAEAITGIAVRTLDDAHAAARRLLDMGAREAVIKLGERGAFYLGKEAIHVPAFPIKPVDTTAAGDAFTAALAMNWNVMERHEAIRFANATGALAAMKAGAQPSMPTLDAVLHFLNEQATGR
jgi:ribokinase